MPNSVITTTGLALFARAQQQQFTVPIDRIIFADIPGLDPAAAPSPAQGLPPAAQIMLNTAIDNSGKSGADTVVYSKILSAAEGDWHLNWIGLYSTKYSTLIAVCVVPRHRKYKTSGFQAGNTLYKNFAIQYANAANLAGITIDAAAWQLNFDDRYERLGAVNAHNSAASPHPGKFAPPHEHPYEAAGAVNTHNSAANPHSGKFDAAGAATTAVSTHNAAASPHPGKFAPPHEHPYEAAGAVNTHNGAANPHQGKFAPPHEHPYEAAGAVNAHNGAAGAHADMRAELLTWANAKTELLNRGTLGGIKTCNAPNTVVTPGVYLHIVGAVASPDLPRNYNNTWWLLEVFKVEGQAALVQRITHWIFHESFSRNGNSETNEWSNWTEEGESVVGAHNGAAGTHADMRAELLTWTNAKAELTARGGLGGIETCLSPNNVTTPGIYVHDVIDAASPDLPQSITNTWWLLEVFNPKRTNGLFQRITNWINHASYTRHLITDGTWSAWTEEGAGALQTTANGYTRLPGGLIIQWGNSSRQGVVAGHISQYLFHLAFPNAALVVVATPNGLSADDGHCVKNITQTGFQFGYNWQGENPEPVHWIAIGY